MAHIINMPRTKHSAGLKGVPPGVIKGMAVAVPTCHKMLADSLYGERGQPADHAEQQPSRREASGKPKQREVQPGRRGTNIKLT